MKGFSESEFLNADFELVGDLDDFHFFEKEYSVSYLCRKISIVFKQYFFVSEALGGGLGVACGVRLTSLLKKQPFAAALRQIGDNRISFYFSEDESEGALIFDESIVIRFGRRSKRSSYMISTVECDFDNERFGDIARKAVHETFECLTPESMISEASSKGCSNAFKRLVRQIYLGSTMQ
ncbi:MULTISPECIES: hypothetical protein [unclassified Pseudomonas]|uniref:hypothetical protein n=1 Tax=unclassified Pseudomonas TaxID=196821 RepID=UPI00191D197D|nr:MULTISPECIES: hypothetical protein [unclassified Pseudomonas]MBL0798402.1 hypothetical protein [Pseudomonas sp. B7]